MSTNDTDDQPADASARTDGSGLATAAQRHEQTDYLDAEVNILRPSTPFMRDHLRTVWLGFLGWVVVVFGPVTLTAVAPGPMTTTLPVVGFPLHYLLVAVGAPGGALVLSVWYARRRGALDEKYGIDHTAPAGEAGVDSEGPTATDGGERG